MALAARAHELLPEPARSCNPKRTATRRRVRAVKSRITSRGLRIAAYVALPVVLVLVYVWLTAELTAQTYRLHDDQAREAALVQRDSDLRQQVARLESLPRLEAAAMKLHMHVPSGVALVAPAHGAPAPAQTALASSIADVRKWFGIR